MVTSTQNHHGKFEDLLLRVDPVIESVIRGNRIYGGIANDLAQDSRMQLWIAYVRYRMGKDIESEIALARTVTKRVCYKHISQLQFRRRIESYSSAPNPDLIHLLQSYINTSSDPILLDELTQAIDRLPKAYRDVIRMRFYQYYSYGQIAHATGCNTSTACRRVQRSIELLRTQLSA